MGNKLKVTSEDWATYLESQKDHTIERLASEIARKHPEIFAKTLVGEEKQKAEQLVRGIVEASSELTLEEREEAIRAIIGQATGYGPLEEFFVGPGAEEITEIMINSVPEGPPRVFIGKHGRQHLIDKTLFRSKDDLLQYLRKICEDVGRPFTEDGPIVDAWLRDGSRIAVVGYKATPIGPCLTIRKSPLVRPPLPMEKLVEYQMFPHFAMDLFKNLIVKGAANLAVCGRTDSGKTTVMRALGLYIEPSNRVLIAETSFELSFPHLANCVNLVMVGYGGEVTVSMSDLCASFNRHNPDRTIVGEIRGGEVVDAANIAESTSGGFWTTLHAGDTEGVRSRFPKMFKSGGMPLDRDDVDTQIRTMFHFMVFVDKAWDAKRTFMELVEVTDDGYQTIIRFDEDTFAQTKGEVRQWVYENPISEKRLNALAFRGAEIKPEYREIHQRILSCWEGDA
ncbi:MAG: CpaF family protein [Desulforudis sp.]|nr:MAG: CpaF family protein [Desulforudis sp.]